MTHQDPRRTPIPRLFTEVLDNGLRVAVLPSAADPYLSVHLIVHAGGLADPPGEEGLAAFCAQTLRHGSLRRSEQELSEALDETGARLGTTTYPDYVDLGGDVTTLDAAGVDSFFEVLTEVALAPSFPAEEVEKVRALRDGSLRSVADHNEQLAGRAFEAAVFRGHPLARHVSGTRTSLAAIRREAIAGYHRDRYLPEGSLLGFAGDVAPLAPLELVTEYEALIDRTLARYAGVDA
jgi:zinc protease